VRETKYRAYDKIAKVMIPNVAVYEDGTHLGMGIKLAKSVYPKDYDFEAASNIEYGENDWLYLMCDFELIQFTGLKDKNKKEIYEGDVCDPDGVIGQYEIKWSEHYGRIMAVCITYVNICGGSLEVSSMTRGTIIGNIYQNPELLEGGGKVK